MKATREGSVEMSTAAAKRKAAPPKAAAAKRRRKEGESSGEEDSPPIVESPWGPSPNSAEKPWIARRNFDIDAVYTHYNERADHAKAIARRLVAILRTDAPRWHHVRPATRTSFLRDDEHNPQINGSTTEVERLFGGNGAPIQYTFEDHPHEATVRLLGAGAFGAAFQITSPHFGHGPFVIKITPTRTQFAREKALKEAQLNRRIALFATRRRVPHLPLTYYSALMPSDKLFFAAAFEQASGDGVRLLRDIVFEPNYQRTYAATMSLIGQGSVAVAAFRAYSKRFYPNDNRSGAHMDVKFDNFLYYRIKSGGSIRYLVPNEAPIDIPNCGFYLVINDLGMGVDIYGILSFIEELLALMESARYNVDRAHAIKSATKRRLLRKIEEARVWLHDRESAPPATYGGVIRGLFRILFGDFRATQHIQFEARFLRARLDRNRLSTPEGRDNSPGTPKDE